MSGGGDGASTDVGESGCVVGSATTSSSRTSTVISAVWRTGVSTLSALAAGAKFDDLDGIVILVQVAEALYELHKAGIIHKDIKPENVLISDDHRIKLIDFSLGTSMM